MLTCDASVAHCYSRDLRGFSRANGCARCIAGGLRTYPLRRYTSIDNKLRTPLDAATLHRLTVSSVAVRLRTEATSDLTTEEFLGAQRSLHRPVETVFANASRWIDEKALDAVLCFNGRMDLTAAVVAACERANRPYVTLERPWFRAWTAPCSRC